jgi:carboxymethylenebutenolidase
MITREVLANGTPIQYAGDSSATKALIVVQEAFGVNDHIRDLCELFASKGFFSVAPEFFHRSGSPEVPYDDFPAAMKPMSELNKEGIEEDLLATSKYLKGLGFDPSATAIVGYCMGGTVTFFASTLGVVSAGATYYGGGVSAGRFGFPPLLELAGELTNAWIGHFGDLDKGIPVEEVEALRDATSKVSFPTEIFRYADAEHGFSCDGRTAVYNEAATQLALERTLAFFDTNVTPR